MPDLADRLKTALAGRYAVQRELGRGGMATVFLAEDLKHRRPVAIKVLLAELAAVIGPERFLREIEIAARLSHPHILPLYDSGAADGLLYYVMPYVAGESLRVRLARERQLPVPDALRLAAEVAGALDYAHRQGVVHRDIKPENILLADGQAVVADFGIARAITAAGTSKLTETGVTLGTPVYMSPEQAVGSGTLDGRSDVYSLACVLYEMLSGQPPFTGPTAESVVHQHLGVAPRPVSVLRSMVPRGVDDALGTALAKAPADRYRSASEFAAALTAAQSGEHPAAETDPTIETDTARARRRRREWLLRIGMVAGAVIVVALAVRYLLRPQDRTVAPTKRAWMLVAEFDGPAEDSSIVAATRDLMLAALDQSEIVAVVPREQVRMALRMAGKPTTARVDAELALELAYRGSVRTVLEGRIGRLGKGYSVVLRVVDTDSRKAVVSVSDAAVDEEALIPTLSRLAQQLRAKLGEQSAAIQPTKPMGNLITSSLEAFEAAQKARELLLQNNNHAAIAWARSAIALDPGFVQAWGLIGFAYLNLGAADSSVHAFRQALARPDRLTPVNELFYQASLATASGDHAVALTVNERLLQLAPDHPLAYNNRAAMLMNAGRFQDALESCRIAERISPFGASQEVVSNQFTALLYLRRVEEARRIVPRFTGSNSLRAPMWIAVAAGDWPAAESTASLLRVNPEAFENHRREAEWVLAAGQASRGRVSAAHQTIRRLQSQAEAAGLAQLAQVARWGSLQLSLFTRGVGSAPGDPGRWDSTTAGLLARGAWAAAAGDTALAQRLLAVVRTRSSTELVQQGFAPELVQAWIAARRARWQEVVRVLGPAALQGEPIGYVPFRSAPLTRWLVAEAYEQLGQPDSAATYFERAVELPPEGGWSFVDSRMASSFGHRRLAKLYARMGRPAEATRHWEAFSLAFTSPDAQLAPWVEEARASLARGGKVTRDVR